MIKRFIPFPTIVVPPSSMVRLDQPMDRTTALYGLLLAVSAPMMRWQTWLKRIVPARIVAWLRSRFAWEWLRPERVAEAVVEGLYVGPEAAIVRPAPSSTFVPESVGARTVFGGTIAHPGTCVTIIIRNPSNQPIRVRAVASGAVMPSGEWRSQW